MYVYCINRTIFSVLSKIFKNNCRFFFRFTAHPGRGFNTLFVQYYSVICRTSDHTVGKPRAEIRTRDDLETSTLTTRPPHLLVKMAWEDTRADRLFFVVTHGPIYLFPYWNPQLYKIAKSTFRGRTHPVYNTI